LSWLQFNRRVLEEALDGSVPLLERIKFLAIFASNWTSSSWCVVGGCKQKGGRGHHRRLGADRMARRAINSPTSARPFAS